MVLCVCSVCIPEAVGLGRLVPHCDPAVEHELQPEQSDDYRQQQHDTLTVKRGYTKDPKERPGNTSTTHCLQLVSSSFRLVHMIVRFSISFDWVLHI